MAFRYKKSFSKTAKREFAQKMDEIENYCLEHGISKSANSDSYYFTINGTKYRVSNHTVESSNAKARNEFGEQVRDVYHPEGRGDTVQIFAGKTRLIEIHEALLAGKKLDGHGRVIEQEKDQ